MRPRFVPSALALALVGCGVGPTVIQAQPASRVDAGPAIAAGRAQWAAREPTCAAYYYDRQISGPLGSTGGIMTVQIADDQPQWRWYIGGDLVMTPSMGTVDWFEDMAMLGTHPNAPPASTVEQLWDECESELMGSSRAQLEVNEDGVPMTCIGSSANCSGAVPPPGVTEVCQGGITLVGFSCGVLVPPTIIDDGGADLVDSGVADVVNTDFTDVADAGVVDLPADRPASE